jgi:hypothetical protein
MKLIEKKQRQTQRILKNLFGLITFLSLGGFFLRESMDLFRNKPLAYVFGAFAAHCLIPACCWTVYVVVVMFQKQKIIKLEQEKIDKINSSATISKEFDAKLKALKGLFEVHLITPEEYELKRNLLIRNFEKLVNYSEEINSKQKQMDILNNALNSGLITEEIHNTKFTKLVSEQNVLKQKYENVLGE